MRTILFEGFSYEFYNALHEVWHCRALSDPAWVRELDRMMAALQMVTDPVYFLFRVIEVSDG